MHMHVGVDTNESDASQLHYNLQLVVQLYYTYIKCTYPSVTPKSTLLLATSVK